MSGLSSFVRGETNVLEFESYWNVVEEAYRLVLEKVVQPAMDGLDSSDPQRAELEGLRSSMTTRLANWPFGWTDSERVRDLPELSHDDVFYPLLCEPILSCVRAFISPLLDPPLGENERNSILRLMNAIGSLRDYRD